VIRKSHAGFVRAGIFPESLQMTEQEPFKLVIQRVRDEGRETRSFDMLPDETGGARRFTFLPGQVAVLRVSGEDSSYFAFASAPEDEELEFLVKRKGGASDMLFEMAAGDHVELIEIVGQGFPLREHKGKDLVFVAMGTGVAPLRSALRHILKHKEDYGQLVVLYGARTPDDFCYRDEIEEWEAAGVELRQVISRPDGHDWFGPTGYVQSLLDHIVPDLSAPVALICGSREMIEQTRDRLRQMGFAPEAILTNY
jgi:sulfhydrogenase subunit gamma (sulfur reductase)